MTHYDPFIIIWPLFRVALITLGDHEGKVCHEQTNASWEIFVNDTCFLTGKTVLKYHPQNRIKKFLRIYYAYLLDLKTNWTIKRIFFIMCVTKVKFSDNFFICKFRLLQMSKTFFFLVECFDWKHQRSMYEINCFMS